MFGRAPAVAAGDRGFSSAANERDGLDRGVRRVSFARMLRFGRVVRAIRAGEAADVADLAVLVGYYDQSHLTRDVREFAGTTPGALRHSLLPDGGGFAI